MTARSIFAISAVLLMGSLPAAAQGAASVGPSPSCAAEDASTPCGSPAPSTFSGTLTWTETSLGTPLGELGSDVTWSATIDLLMDADDTGGLVSRGGSYTYTEVYTGHCHGTSSGSGSISSEQYASATVGIGAVSASALADGEGDLVFSIALQPEEYVLDCDASPGFDASTSPAGYSPRRPYCTGVYGDYAPGPPVVYHLRCVEQDVPGIDVTIEGTLTNSTSAGLQVPVQHAAPSCAPGAVRVRHHSGGADSVSR